MNASKSECSIDVPVTILIGKYEYAILLNVIFNIGLTFTAAVGNILIILSFMLVSSLRTTSNYVLFGLALTDLGVGLIVHPLYILVLYRVYKNAIPDCNIVTAYSVSTTFFAGVSLLYITFIGLDRFLAIRLHLRYPLLVTEKRVSLVQLSIWATNALLSLVWMEGFHVYSTLGAVVIAISLVATFAVYIKIYLVVRRHKAQIRDQMAAQSEQSETNRLKKQRRSAINTFYVFFAFLVCYFPFFVTTAVNKISSGAPNVSVVLIYEFTVTLMFSNSSLNPVMYCLRLRDFRIAVKRTYRRIFCLDAASEWSYQRLAVWYSVLVFLVFS